MPNVVLIEPFIRHYVGSVFHVNEAIGEIEEDDRLRDRQPCYDTRIFFLPDNGKGIPTNLPLPYTMGCPDYLFENIDIKSGPCRITSVSPSLESINNDPFYASPLPMGKGKVLLYDSAVYVKNITKMNFQLEQPPYKILISNRLTASIVDTIDESTHEISINFSNYPPGFYQVDVLYNETILAYFTVIKNFPLVVYYDYKTQKYITSNTLW